MLARDRKNVERSASTTAEYAVKSATKSGRPDARSRGADGRGFTLPETDQGRLTMISLFIIAVLAVLNVMLRYPELGAVIAPFNQF